MLPLISIITVNLNNKDGLNKTILSVINQTYRNFEHIVIDGESNDGSRELLEMYSSNFSYWVSENDTGIYNGMNKGIVRAKGDYLLFLNSGDCFFDENSLKKIIPNGNCLDLVFGNLLVQTQTGSYIKRYPSQLSFDFFYNWESLPHPATLVKKDLFTRIGLYREDMKISSDGYFFLTALARFGATYKHVDEVIVVFDGSGISGKESYRELLANERSQILNDFNFYVNDYALLNSLRLKVSHFENSLLHRIAEKIQHSYFWRVAKKLKIMKSLLRTN